MVRNSLQSSPRSSRGVASKALRLSRHAVATAWFVGVCGLLSILNSSTAVAVDGKTDKPPLVRELFVPFEDLDVVLKDAGRRFFLTRVEYDELVRKASVSTEAPAPRTTSLLSPVPRTTVT